MLSRNQPCLGRSPVLLPLHPQHLSSSSLFPAHPSELGLTILVCLDSISGQWEAWAVTYVGRGEQTPPLGAAGFSCLQFLWFSGMFKWCNQAITTSAKRCLKADAPVNKSLLNTHPLNVKWGGGGERRVRRLWREFKNNNKKTQTKTNKPEKNSRKQKP